MEDDRLLSCVRMREPSLRLDTGDRKTLFRSAPSLMVLLRFSILGLKPMVTEKLLLDSLRALVPMTGAGGLMSLLAGRLKEEAEAGMIILFGEVCGDDCGEE